MFGGHQIKNHLQKTGGVMTGDLNLGLNRLILTDGSTDGAILRGMGGPSSLRVRNILDNGNGYLTVNALYPDGNVDGIDVSEINQAKIFSGSYTGDGNDDRTINIGIDLTAKSYVWILIKSSSNAVQAVCRPEQAQGDLTQYLSAGPDAADLIQGLKATGFELGTTAIVNQNGATFRYVIIYEEP